MSADWCPRCREQAGCICEWLAPIRAILWRAGVRVFALFPHEVEEMKEHE